MHIIYFDHISPELHSQLHVLVCFYNSWVQFVLLMCSWVWGIQWGRVALPGAMPLKITVLFSSRQSSIAPELGMGGSDLSPARAGVLPNLISCRFWTHIYNCSCCRLMTASVLSCPEGMLLYSGHLYPLAPTNFIACGLVTITYQGLILSSTLETFPCALPPR